MNQLQSECIAESIDIEKDNTTHYFAKLYLLQLRPLPVYQCDAAGQLTNILPPNKKLRYFSRSMISNLLSNYPQTMINT